MHVNVALIKFSLSLSKALSTLATIVADFGDCCRIRRQIVAVCGDSPNTATIVV